jgi:2,3-dihydroxybenzoate decarboxylase
MGIDRIMFSIDWPYASNTAGVNWMKKSWLNENDKEKILSGNAKRLLRI